MRRSVLLLMLLIVAVSFFSFFGKGGVRADRARNAALNDIPETISLRDKLFDTLLCDGFDYPVGDKDAKGSYTSLQNGKTYTGWFKATKTGEEYFLGIHTGEDWNGSGGGNTDLGQTVYATASGLVLHAAECPSPWGNVILIEHRFIENGRPCTVYSQYAHLKEMHVKKGQVVKRRQKIGSIGQGNHKEYPAHLHFEIRKENAKDLDVDYWPSSHNQSVEWVMQHYYDCSEFIKAHRQLTVPAKLDKFALVVKKEFKCYYYEKGKLKKTYEVALGQEPVGAKQIQGDLKVPEGEYRVCEKSEGPFAGDWVKAYLGTRWLRLNYPNAFDAKRGLEQKLITKAQHDAIVSAVKQNLVPPKGSKLGGGIGIHGWIDPDWTDDGSRALTWGCVSLHKKDLEEFYELAPMNMTVVIAP
ncbi:MAG: peptidoglycan DD-metalloendopeptidase family protein [Bacteroidota bacterium]